MAKLPIKYIIAAILIVLAIVGSAILVILNQNAESPWHPEYVPRESSIDIAPDSYNYFFIDYPTNKLYIDINSGNATTLHPMILDGANFTLYQQGKTFQTDPMTNDIIMDPTTSRFTYNNMIEAHHYVLIKNNDKNNVANVTFRTFVPLK